MNTAEPSGRYLVVCADDLGLTQGFNQAVRIAHTRGLLTSTCVLAGGAAYEHARDEVLAGCPGLGLGVHLATDAGRPCGESARIPDLMGRRGYLACGFARLWRICRRREVGDQVRREFAAQIERVLGDGLAVDHLNGHRHVHMIPAVFRIVCRLADEYDIPFVRLVEEPFYTAGGVAARTGMLLRGNPIKRRLLNRMAISDRRLLSGFQVKAADQVVGVLYSGHMSVETVLAGLRACRSRLVELVCHISTGPEPDSFAGLARGLEKFARGPQRQREADALVSGRLRRFLDEHPWRAINVRQAQALGLAGAAQSADGSPSAVATVRHGGREATAGPRTAGAEARADLRPGTAALAEGGRPN